MLEQVFAAFQFIVREASVAVGVLFFQETVRHLRAAAQAALCSEAALRAWFAFLLALMGIGALATIAVQAPGNLAVVVIDQLRGALVGAGLMDDLLAVRDALDFNGDVQGELEQQHKKMGDLDRQTTALDATISQDRAAYERENAHYIQSEPAKSVANKAQKVIHLIDELLPRLFDLKTQELSQAVSRYIKQLAHKEQVSSVSIQADGTCRLMAEDGKEVQFDRSAGENQIFATALFAGLAQVSGYHIPLMVDTPLARLDSKHRDNLLRYWYSDPDRQVILLSQDKEVDETLLQSVRPYLGKTYLLESTLIGYGVYRTIAKENAYFGGPA